MKKIVSLFRKIAYWMCVFVLGCTLISCGTNSGEDSNSQSSTGAKIECANHTFGDWIVVYRPTCTMDGLKERICEVCGVAEQETTPAGHTVADTYHQYARKHEKRCLFCETLISSAEHEYDGDMCMVCGYDNLVYFSLNLVHLVNFSKEVNLI